LCGGDQPFLNGAELQMEHNRCHSLAISAFKSAKKMGGTELSAQFLERLEEDIVVCLSLMYCKYISLN
jgi:hypothetical protein